MTSEKKLPSVREIFLVPTPRPLGVCDPLPKTPRRQTSILKEDKEQCRLSEEEDIVDIKKVTVKFSLENNKTIAQVYPDCMTLAEVKTDLARRFEVPRNLLILKQGNHLQSDLCTIRETDRDEYGIYVYKLELKQKSIEKDEKPLKLDLKVYYSKYHLPDFITVFIPAEDTHDGIEKNLIVEIQNLSIPKPFLHGYVNKVTGVEYVDAFSQTGPKNVNFENLKTRDSQTYILRTSSNNTTHDQISQCWLDGNNLRYWSEGTDYNVTPRKYIRHAQKEMSDNKLGKIRLIQRNFRRWRWMKWMKECAQQFRYLTANRLAMEEAFRENQKLALLREERAKKYPRTKDDFDLLYGEIEKWKIAEMKRITGMYEGAARIAEINILLDKEIELLNGLDRQKKLVFKAIEDFRQEKLIDKMGEPITWIGYGDTIIHLDLLRNQRVRFLKEIYKDLQEDLPKNKRLDLIAKVKKILLNEQDFPDFAELFELFDRERNLLIYTKYCEVDVLRNRQNNLFVELIKFDREPKAHKPENRMCVVCKLVKPYSQFAIRTRQFQVDTCTNCNYLREASIDNLVYTAILRSIQREERKNKCNGSFAFVMQVDDVRHLVQQIWHGHSILSKCEKLSKLRLPRWVKNEEWSPWNCVCLTETETINHNRIEDLKKVYDYNIHLEVRNRHMLAKNVFHNLTAVAVEFTESGKWWTTGLTKQRVVTLKDFSLKRDKDKDK